MPVSTRFIRYSISFFFALLLLPFISVHMFADSATCRELVKRLDTLKVNNQAICAVEGLIIERDGLMLSLDSGTVTFAEPIDGRVHFAQFKGTGSITFEPTTNVEKAQLALYNEKSETFRGIIEEVFLYFNDSTFEEVTQQFPPEKKYFKLPLVNFPWTLKDIYYYEDNYLNDISVQGFLEKRRNQSMFCITKCTNKNTCLYSYNTLLSEPISFTLYEGKSLKSDRIYVNSCPRPESIDLIPKQLEEVSITKEQLNVDIKDNLEMSVQADISYVVLSDDIRWAELSLHHELKVTSIQDENGNSFEYFQPKESYSVWVKMPQNSKKGLQGTWKINYSGKIIKRIYDHTYIESSISWYPTYGYKNKSLFDITFTIPDNYKIVSIGDNISTEEKDDKLISRWAVDYPIRNASFNIGPFRQKKMERKGVPPVTLHYITAKNLDNIVTDVAQAYEFYTNLYGPLPNKSINATEIPYSHGEAFPGMLHLTYFLFASGENTGEWESFTAHETGHQWWGIGVDFATYRDRWISEAFTEYSSIMYTQLVLKDNEKVFGLLNNHKKELLARKKQRLKDGVDLCPVSMGHRAGSTSLTRGDYQPVVYYKGAWTLHMLRNMLLNLNTMKEDMFMKIMKEFFTTYQGKEATTKDFQRLVEKNIGQDISWFFDQWIDGTAIPEYHFAYKPEKQPDGKYKVKVRIMQKNVPADFKMSVPIKIVFKSGDIARIRVLMTGEKAEFDLPPLPQEPKEVIFNDLESVLCTVIDRDWD